MQHPNEHSFRSLRRSTKWSFFVAGLVMLLVLGVGYCVIFWLEKQAIGAQQLAAQYWADSFTSRFEGRIESNIALGRGISAQAAVMGEVTQAQLNVLVEELKDPDLDVRHVAIAPDLVISAVYPLEGNEGAIGLNYRAHPQQREAVMYAVEHRAIVLVGPLTLVQGTHRQLIARLPVFRLNQSLWGMVSVVIDLNTLLQATEFEKLEQNYNIEITKLADNGKYFVDRSLDTLVYSSSTVIDFDEANPVNQVISIPSGQWLLKLQPRSPWGFSHLRWIIYSLIALVIAFIIASIVFLLHRNFSLKREYIQHLKSMLAIDPLTRLASRHQFKVILNKLVEQCTLSGEEFSVLVIDIDHFKEVNDSLGHVIGDSILVEIAMRLKADGHNHDLLARLGGDEFVLVLRKMSDLRGIEQIARQLMAKIAEVIRVGKNEIRLTSSIGVSVFPLDAQDAETLMQHADLAVFESKRVGRNAVYFFDAARREEADRFVKMSTEIRSALDAGEFFVYFQPIYCIETGKFSRCEALCRWQNSKGEFISPAEFIPIAERCGLILELGRFVLDQSIALSKKMRARNIHMPISINRSAVEFASDESTQTLIRDVVQQRITTEDIFFEITESLFMSDDKAKVANYWKLKKTGFSFAIDDFGTGYSSINYLRQFPVEYLKIDRSFVIEIDADNDRKEGRVLVKAIIQMAKSLGMKVIAEGVETQIQFRYLAEVGCDLIQGYLFARPMSEEDLLPFLDKQTAESSQEAAVRKE